ncbi:MAG: OmpA family protein [Deltaproteobacteria bacterium]|nr:OmpA family protein [Deltaproteobacteria bacterium]
MKKKAKNKEEGGGKWLTTFNDMVTLLLTFFVLVLSMADTDSGKVKEMCRSVQDAFGMLQWGELSGVRAFTPFISPRGNQILTYEKKKEALADHLNEITGIDATVTENGVSIIMGEKVLFETAKADFGKKDQTVLEKLSPILKNADCQIRVEGHTDNVPISNEYFASNWELSTARAVALIKYFIHDGGISPERLSAAGYADARPRFANISDSNRAFNRRVEIILTLKE